jgi:hypothetical protein
LHTKQIKDTVKNKNTRQVTGILDLIDSFFGGDVAEILLCN